MTAPGQAWRRNATFSRKPRKHAPVLREPATVRPPLLERARKCLDCQVLVQPRERHNGLCTACFERWTKQPEPQEEP